jgi:hypothetical protein
MRPRTFFTDANKARDAFESFVLPGIMSAMTSKHVKRSDLHVVVLIPGVQYESIKSMPILFEYQIGDTSKWEWPYDQYARGKARITWRTGLSSREVILMKPHLMERGDPRYWGSCIIDGVIVGVSGVQPHFDELFARMTAAAICAEATNYAEMYAQSAEAKDFLP